MTDIRNFYEQMYKGGRDGATPKGLIGWLFVKLRRFELHRTDKAIMLLKGGKRLLDIGCGNANLLIKAKKKELYNNYFGVDIAEAVIKNAKKNISKSFSSANDIKLTREDLDNKLKFDSKSFDTITCIANLEHVFDPISAISEFNRLLVKNGQLILEVPNLVWLPRRFILLLGKLPRTGDENGGWDSGHLHYFTFSSLEKLLIEKGFKISWHGCSGVFHKIRNVYPELLSANVFISAEKIRNV